MLPVIKNRCKNTNLKVHPNTNDFVLQFDG